ncbi:hypothetical protein [Roseovarius sp. ZX-A-9]|uniref:hypothetical protein n=1 Tax=Roseovarius sp. ZX-A-9 TaxID=3014783 RepID=UPI00232B81C7|nr:hypothetical protein [Roseovarius sp. ZX-A-9]
MYWPFAAVAIAVSLDGHELNSGHLVDRISLSDIEARTGHQRQPEFTYVGLHQAKNSSSSAKGLGPVSLMIEAELARSRSHPVGYWQTSAADNSVLPGSFAKLASNLLYRPSHCLSKFNIKSAAVNAG